MYLLWPGPILIDQFQQSIEARGLSRRLHVFATSHIGGHKFAATLMIYPGILNTLLSFLTE
jgi:hypothetical protein